MKKIIVHSLSLISLIYGKVIQRHTREVTFGATVIASAASVSSESSVPNSASNQPRLSQNYYIIDSNTFSDGSICLDIHRELHEYVPEGPEWQTGCTEITEISPAGDIFYQLKNKDGLCLTAMKDPRLTRVTISFAKCKDVNFIGQKFTENMGFMYVSDKTGQMQIGFLRMGRIKGGRQVLALHKSSAIYRLRKIDYVKDKRVKFEEPEVVEEEKQVAADVKSEEQIVETTVVSVTASETRGEVTEPKIELVTDALDVDPGLINQNLDEIKGKILKQISKEARVAEFWAFFIRFKIFPFSAKLLMRYQFQQDR